MCLCAEEAHGNAFFSKQERLLSPCLLEHGVGGVGEQGLHSESRYMDGLRRFPSFIKHGGCTRSDAELILQKKQDGRATTSLVSPSYKSQAGAAALTGAAVTTPYYRSTTSAA